MVQKQKHEQALDIVITQPSVASAQAILAVEEHHGLPVLFKVAGYYPEDLITVNGTPFRDVERMVVVISGGDGHWTLVSADRIEGAWAEGRQRSLPLGRFTIRAVERRDALRQARAVCADALAIGAVLDVNAAYEEALQVLTRLRAVPAQLARPAYEAACAEYGVEALSDRDCSDYGVEFGEFDFPHHPVPHIKKMTLARRRLAAIKAEQAARPRTPRPASTLIRADCGHDVPRDRLLRASRGSSCEACYDRMSS